MGARAVAIQCQSGLQSARRFGPSHCGMSWSSATTPDSPASPNPRTFMRSRFLDNLVLRSDAMVGSGPDASRGTARAHYQARSVTSRQTRPAPRTSPPGGAALYSSPPLCHAPDQPHPPCPAPDTRSCSAQVPFFPLGACLSLTSCHWKWDCRRDDCDSGG